MKSKTNAAAVAAAVAAQKQEASALELLGEVPGYILAGLTEKFADKVRYYQKLKETYERNVGDLKDEIFEELAATGLTKVQVDHYVPQIIYATRNILDEKLLLQNGVPATTITASKRKSNSVYLQIKDLDKKRKKKGKKIVPISEEDE